jgi:hypothetical protein
MDERKTYLQRLSKRCKPMLEWMAEQENLPDASTFLTKLVCDEFRKRGMDPKTLKAVRKRKAQH